MLYFNHLLKYIFFLNFFLLHNLSKDALQFASLGVKNRS